MLKIKKEVITNPVIALHLEKSWANIPYRKPSPFLTTVV
jgi:hypothetical protein